MKFHEQLNEYIEQLDCTGKELSQSSGISAAALSRYRKGERLPDPSTGICERLCTAIAEAAAARGMDGPSAAQVWESFCGAEDFDPINCEQLLRNFNQLLTVLSINMNKLCRSISYDVSTVFRFRNGTRRPAEPKKYAAAVAEYVVREQSSAQDLAILSKLLSCREEEIIDDSARFEQLVHWLLSGKTERESSIFRFLTRLDAFDFHEFAKSSKLDELRVPAALFQIPTSGTYGGIEEMKAGELDFLKATVLSSAENPVTMYSDMPIRDMAKDSDFSKKWKLGMAMLLKKGLHLNQIHNIDRSWDEMILGLEGWIPLYMTGQISPYYLKSRQDHVFLHLLKVSGAAALSGEAIAGHHANGKYYLTKSKKEIAYYAARAQALLSNAAPLMQIYRSNRAGELDAFLYAASDKAGRRRSILSTLPIYTMNESLLTAVLRRYKITREESEGILAYATAKRERVEQILAHDLIIDEISEWGRDDFAERSLPLDLSGSFCEKNIFYTYEEYLEHLASTRRFAESHPNYQLKQSNAHTFRNLQISIHEGEWAMISKGRAPSIHFVVLHPKMLQAIEKYIPPAKI